LQKRERSAERTAAECRMPSRLGCLEARGLLAWGKDDIVVVTGVSDIPWLPDLEAAPVSTLASYAPELTAT